MGRRGGAGWLVLANCMGFAEGLFVVVVVVGAEAGGREGGGGGAIGCEAHAPARLQWPLPCPVRDGPPN